ncbi:hypothetical protein ABEB36_002246 [Hypothenemus hampei]|uniref:Large ribosomal subunit protein mL37 n=1 Tax=Hypothenemus hampei TaxID=57062 RepID=A0ABD1F5G0_HYPHA
MRITQILNKQHLGWHFYKHWLVQGKAKIQDTGAEAVLTKHGIKVKDANKYMKDEYFKEIRVDETDRITVIGEKALEPIIDNFHERPLLTYGDENVLLEGLTQAKILTNTVQIQEGLPSTFHIKDIPKEINRRVKKAILGAHVFDAEQQKLAKIKDPEKPAWNFPRIYGITPERVFKLLITKLLNIIETSTNLTLVRERYLAENLYFSLPFERNGDLIQFQLLGDLVLLSEKPLSPITHEKTNEYELPNIFPIQPTITLNQTQNYDLETLYPIKKGAPKCHPHTLFINFNKETVKNLYEEKVTEEQIFGRTLLKTFTAAASYAKTQYGDAVKKLPTPVTLQAIQTDGQKFYFGVLQLNTLDVDSDQDRNIWYQTPALNLFSKCAYELGKPVLENYDRNVINHIVTFYNNV